MTEGHVGAGTTLVAVRKPTADEERRGAEIVFERLEERDSRKATHVILACTVYESWEQWGAIRDVLCDNVPAVEAWRHGRRIPGL